MRIINVRTLAGPNVHSYAPTLFATLDLEDLAGKKSLEIPGVIDGLLAALPGLRSHYCGSESRQRRLCCGQMMSEHSYLCAEERPADFLGRLQGGMDLGHIVAHVALELTTLAGLPALHGKTREGDEPSLCDVIIEYKAEEATRFLLKELG